MMNGLFGKKGINGCFQLLTIDIMGDNPPVWPNEEYLGHMVDMESLDKGRVEAFQVADHSPGYLVLNNGSYYIATLA